MKTKQEPDVMVDEEVVRYWRECAPADREAAESAIRGFYDLFSIEPYPEIEWAPNPLAWHLRIEEICGNPAQFPPNPCHVSQAVSDSCRDILAPGQEKFLLGDQTEQARHVTAYRGLRLANAGALRSHVARESILSPEYLANLIAEVRSPRAKKLVDLVRTLARAQGGMFWWAYGNRAVVCERLTRISFDDQGRLHSVTGPALAYPGLPLYFLHGVAAPQALIEDPGSLTVEQIMTERNAEVRRVMIDRFGQQKFFVAAGAKLISADLYGQLWRLDFPGNTDEAIMMVKVKNSTPEPDGTIKDYWLRVPPQMQSPRAAIAWTFGVAPGDYDPIQET